MLVPEVGSDIVRARMIEGWDTSPSPFLVAKWSRRGDGYAMRITLSSGELPSDLDVIVNEQPRRRARRRGQLVLSGARGEFVYLRGDRHEADRLVPLRSSDA
jgi:hypothetical protein